MAKLTRVYQKLFGVNGGAIGVFGSAQANSPASGTLTSDPATVQSLAAYEAGWASASIGGTRRPTQEEFNGINFVNTRQLSYLFQEGIAVWDSSTEYHENSIVKEDGTTNIYKSITNTNTGNALTDIANWEFLGDLKNPIQATETDAGIAEIATQAETDAGLDDTKILTPTKLANSVYTSSVASQAETDAGTVDNKYTSPLKINEAKQLQSFATLCSVSGLNTTITAGNNLNLLSLFGTVNESLRKETYFDLKDTSNVTITNFLNVDPTPANNKFVFPSNLNTFNKGYKGYVIRVNTVADYAGASGATEEYNFRIRRVIDNSIIDTRVLPRVELDSLTGVNRGVLFQTFVNTETDPYVLDGMYIDLAVPAGGQAITLTSLSVLIQTI